MRVKGYTPTWALDQGQILGNDQLFQALYNTPLSDGKRNGICSGLSMIWAARRMMFHSESAEQRAKAIYTNAAFIWGGKTQDIHAALSATTGDAYTAMNELYGDPLKAYALRVSGTNCKKEFTSDFRKLADVATDVADPPGTYTLWSIGLSTANGNAGHMVASYSSQGSLIGGKHFYLFDPNLGEYRINAKDSYDFTWNLFEAYASQFLGVRYIYAFEVVR
ncbi:hypothetical protein GXW78_20940 [Roseomonas terrae]|jgi:hypothetical protein|uniref:Peptidase C58 YopT-type domain-containing protein n=1 Tax=Neoroseomonas terrae TaxID=424799 RepID=A0ABS5EM77_9PROT|nr:YopT-type cysteine protease domain-containing protein [Neoroseomonas terrae]MBR0652135.1 hypothetical protein [Neoroseomonas terrae]